MFLVNAKQIKLDRDTDVTIKDLCVKYGLCKASMYRILGSYLFWRGSIWQLLLRNFCCCEM
jgi:hypothetical protein